MMKYSDLSKILPHKKPMILIDKVLEFDVQNLTLKAEVIINENPMFYDKSLGGVPSWIGLEYMAQTIAALSGIYESERDGGEPIMGFILGTRKYENNIAFYENEKSYYILAEEQFNNMELCSFKCTVTDKIGKVCASAELNVFRPLDPQKFIRELHNG